jgi:hypothetical protein
MRNKPKIMPFVCLVALGAFGFRAAALAAPGEIRFVPQPVG